MVSESENSPEDNSKGVRIVSRPRSDEIEALIKFKEDMIVNGVNSLNDFAKTMIGIISGFFAAYFALVKFLGAETLTQLNNIHWNDVVSSPIFFVIGIVMFVISYTPVYLFSTEISNIGAIRNLRFKLILIKYIPALIGIAMFLIGLSLTINLCVRLLF